MVNCGDAELCVETCPYWHQRRTSLAKARLSSLVGAFAPNTFVASFLRNARQTDEGDAADRSNVTSYERCAAGAARTPRPDGASTSTTSSRSAHVQPLSTCKRCAASDASKPKMPSPAPGSSTMVL